MALQMSFLSKLILVLGLPVFAAGAYHVEAGLRGTNGGDAAAAALEVSLHDQMRSMMADDGADEPFDGQEGLLQTGNGVQADSDASYMQESASSLSAALGPRWVGSELEADARRKTDTLLKGIAGHKALNSLNNLLDSLP
mmetsp:Transcript_33491/g.92763  ORF Transcript_33491/g.92763 Transcript_33491/m.92763 type:complete len:140 (-) Transcript_33491:94-513(-)